MANKKTLGQVSSNLIVSLYDIGKTIFNVADVEKTGAVKENIGKHQSKNLSLQH